MWGCGWEKPTSDKQLFPHHVYMQIAFWFAAQALLAESHFCILFCQSVVSWSLVWEALHYHWCCIFIRAPSFFCPQPCLPLPQHTLDRRWLSDKESAYSAGGAGEMGSFPGLGRFPGGGNGTPVQYSCWENPLDRGKCQATFHGVAESWTRLRKWTCIHRSLWAHQILYARLV